METETGYFLIKDNKRYRLPTRRILESWKFPLIVPTTDASVAHLRVAAKLGFRDGSLIHNFSDGRIYLISNNKRRHITDPDYLDMLGGKSRVVNVSNFEVNLQELGEELG